MEKTRLVHKRVFLFLCSMILYNVTVNLEDSIHDEWLTWMVSEHIPDVLATGFFESYKLCRILEREEEGITYSVQYFCKDLVSYRHYRDQFASALQKKHTEKFLGKFVAFRTIMEVIHQQ